MAGLGAVGLAILVRTAENTADGRWTLRRVFEGTGALWTTLLVSAAATLVNPLGFRLWVYTLTEISHSTNRHYIAEWAPASLSNDPWSTVVLTLMTGMLAMAAYLAHRLRRSSDPPTWYWVASCVPLIAMAYLSVRHVPLAAIWVSSVIALLGSRIGPGLTELVTPRRFWFLLRGAALVPVCATCVIVLANPAPVVRADGAVLGPTHPCGAVQFLRQNGVVANVYTPLWWGAYVTWELYPAVRVSMDGRNISLYSREMVLENLKFYSDPASAVDVDIPLHYDTDILLIPSNSPVLSAFVTNAQWRRVYADDDAALFARLGTRQTAIPSMRQNSALATNLPRCAAVLN
jgi:hypothetical protein